MRILLVRPPRIKQAVTVSEMMFSEPLGLQMVYGALKNDNQVQIFDMMVESGLIEDIESFDPDIVGFTSLCIDVAKVLELSRSVKEHDSSIITLAGGTQCLLRPESFFDQSVDYVFQFTTVENLQELINDIEAGIHKPIPGILSRSLGYLDAGIKGRNEYMLPDRISTARYREHYSYFGYRPAAIMEYGTGCGKACDFCLRWRIEGVAERLIDPEITKKDLLEIKEDTIMFIDNDFFCSREKLTGFIELAKELKLQKNYIVYGSVEGLLQCRDLLAGFSRIGLKAVLVGYETFSDKELSEYRKKATNAENLEAAKLLRELGIDVWASFMAHPDWKQKDFRSLRKYIRLLDPEISSINPLTPFPGLPIYETFKNRLLFPVDDFEKWSFGQVVVMPSRMSLRAYYWELMKTYLYINLFRNRSTDMIRKYGMKSLIRIGIGTMRLSSKYMKLIIKG
jgi:radical SAM superfamily enzyme YgiQ (UPF0313 family)